MLFFAAFWWRCALLMLIWWIWFLLLQIPERWTMVLSASGDTHHLTTIYIIIVPDTCWRERERERKREKFLYDQYLLKVVWTRYFFVGSIFLWWVWRLVAFKAMSQVCHHITFSQWVQWNFLIWIETRGMTCGESFLASNLYQKIFLKKYRK
jgi:hypothetical protein